ncbi:AhpC/TSA family protein [Acrodontium crateriforme]|uniref:AhpC/TSA family protein n=1 Tax=Acrodontium crateriforme TaxID=150365 RepID=A0AAQ3R9G6_9PEZI|nr:AhpC/TSA family protein [Acrodontium crateriforme]
MAWTTSRRLISTPRLWRSALPQHHLPLRRFHAAPHAGLRVQVGHDLPDVELVENSPGNKVSIAQELRAATAGGDGGGGGKGLVIGVPAAFSPACSESHIPAYLNHDSLQAAGQVFVVSVNDPFVMKAWAKSLDPEQKIRFLADPHATFTNALDLAFDATKIFGQPRSKRYALVIENGKIKEAHVEPDNTGLNVSAAKNVLG